MRRGADRILKLLLNTQWTSYTESGGRATTSATLSFSPSGEPGAVRVGLGVKGVGGESRVVASAPRVRLGTWDAFLDSVDHMRRVWRSGDDLRHFEFFAFRRAGGCWPGVKGVGGESRVAASAPRVRLGTWDAFLDSVDHVRRVWRPDDDLRHFEFFAFRPGISREKQETCFRKQVSCFSLEIP